MDFVRELKKRGYRITNPREVICSILENSGHEHFTVEKLHQLTTKKDKNIELSSKKVLIIGAPGSGKTRCLQTLTTK